MLPVTSTPVASQQVRENIGGPGHASLQDSCLAETLSPVVTVTTGNGWPRILQQQKTRQMRSPQQAAAAGAAGAAAMPEAGTEGRGRRGGMS